MSANEPNQTLADQVLLSFFRLKLAKPHRSSGTDHAIVTDHQRETPQRSFFRTAGEKFRAIGAQPPGQEKTGLTRRSMQLVNCGITVR